MAIDRDREVYREADTRTNTGGLVAGLLIVLVLVIGGYFWLARDHGAGNSVTSGPAATTTVPKDTSTPAPKSDSAAPPAPATK